MLGSAPKTVDRHHNKKRHGGDRNGSTRSRSLDCYGVPNRHSASRKATSSVELARSAYADPSDWLSDGDEIPVQRRWNLRSANTFRHATADFDLELILQNIDGEVIDFYNSPDRNQINISDRRVVLQASLRFH